MPGKSRATGWQSTAQHDRRGPWRIVDYDPMMLPEMTDLWVGAWKRAMPGVDFEARRGWLVGHVVVLIKAGTIVRVLVDRRNDRLIGFVTFDPQRNWLDQLVVGLGYQGSGASQALLGEARRLSSGVVRLDVNAENTHACAFYAREGFMETGHGVNPTSGRPTIQMEWRRS